MFVAVELAEEMVELVVTAQLLILITVEVEVVLVATPVMEVLVVVVPDNLIKMDLQEVAVEEVVELHEVELEEVAELVFMDNELVEEVACVQPIIIPKVALEDQEVVMVHILQEVTMEQAVVCHEAQVDEPDELFVLSGALVVHSLQRMLGFNDQVRYFEKI